MRFALAANDTAALSVPVKCRDTQNLIRGDGLLLQLIHRLSWGLVEEVFDPSGHAVVQAIHPSVVDFFLYEGLWLLTSLQPRVSVGSQSSGEVISVSDTVRQSHGVLYRCCLNYLATEDIETAVRELDLARISNRPGALISSPSHPFITYATLNMFVHAEKAVDQRVMGIADEVSRLRSVIGYWTAAYRALAKDSITCPRVGSTVLHAAAAAGLVDVVQYLFQRNADIEYQEANEALRLAACHGHEAVVRILLSIGVDVNALDEHRGTALQAAAYQGHLDIAETLLSRGADVNAPGGGRYGTALQAAASQGHLDIVKTLLLLGADVSARGGGQDDTALEVALSQGHRKIVERLLQAGATLN